MPERACKAGVLYGIHGSVGTIEHLRPRLRAPAWRAGALTLKSHCRVRKKFRNELKMILKTTLELATSPVREASVNGAEPANNFRLPPNKPTSRY